MAKRKHSKKGVKKTPLKTSTTHHRGTRSKSINFEKGRKNPDRITDTLKDFDYSTFDYLRRKNKPIEGAGYKPPQGITVIVTIKKGGNTFHYTKLSPPDFVVNADSVETFVQETVENLKADYDTAKDAIEDDENEPETEGAEYIENLDPAFISDVTVRFFYGK